MLDIDKLLGDLERILLDVASLSPGEHYRAAETRRYGRRGEVEVSTSVKVGFLDEIARASPPPLSHEPLVDVIESEDGFKVLVLLPGVRRDDIRFTSGRRSLVFEINTRGRSYRKEIACDVPPSAIAIKSVVENNSVVEITFAKKPRIGRR